MFNAKTPRITGLSRKHPSRITELESIFDKPTNIYIDFANAIRWQERLGWRIDLKRLKQLFDSFDTIKEVKFYSGTLVGNKDSEDFINKVKKYRYKVTTKPVKIMKFPINIASIPINSPDIISQFIRPALLKKLDIETIESINKYLKQLNKQGIMYLEDKKCNFDVEIGSDMRIDSELGRAEIFALWSGDSDFADPIQTLLGNGKRCTLFATARKVAKELNDLTQNGLIIFEVKKLRDFICWPRELK
jgi:uncharacterized LabA/DUF88 family protein